MTNPTDQNEESIDSKLETNPQLADLMDEATNAEINRRPPQKHRAPRYDDYELPIDATIADLEEAILSDMLEDPSFPSHVEDMVEIHKKNPGFTLPNMKLDKSFPRIISAMLRKYDGLLPAERRTQIFRDFCNLGADTTDADLEAAIRAEISRIFEAPISPEFVQDCVTTILTKATV